jgi:multidrug resistance efflux pump
LQSGPDPDTVRLAEARVSNAQEQLAASQAALDDLELQAPFDGTVSGIEVRASEWVQPGQPVMTLADLNGLHIETTDLNEIDVARVEAGDPVIITFDALPDVQVRGRVARIASKAAEGSGVNYPVVIEMDEIPEQLRWGMTAFVDIEVD